MMPSLAVLDVLGAVEQTVALAPHVEQLGYARYWIAEHQPQPSPTLLAAIVAGLTHDIRVGTAGILLHYYTPLRAAHDFHFLERAYEGRIDAGFCAGIDPRTPHIEYDGRDLPAIFGAYQERVARFVGHLRNTPGNPTYEPKMAWHGALDDPPQVWYLGGSLRSAEQAAQLGAYYGYSLLYKESHDDPSAAQRYRERFVPDRTQATPRTSIAVCGACAPTRTEAEALSSQLSSAFFVPRIVGEPSECADRLRALAERFGVDEIAFADRIGTLDARKRCYELLAEALAR